MSFWEGEPSALSKYISLPIRESLAWLKTKVDSLLDDIPIDIFPLVGDNMRKTVLRNEIIRICYAGVNRIRLEYEPPTLNRPYNSCLVQEMETYDYGKGDSYWGLNFSSMGEVLRFSGSCFDNTATKVMGVIASTVFYNTTGTEIGIQTQANFWDDYFYIRFVDPLTNAALDLTTIVTYGKEFRMQLLYVTSK